MSIKKELTGKNQDLVKNQTLIPLYILLYNILIIRELKFINLADAINKTIHISMVGNLDIDQISYPFNPVVMMNKVAAEVIRTPPIFPVIVT